MSTQRDIADQLIDVINATGGVIKVEEGIYAPQADPDWTDLGAVYMTACAEKCEPPEIAPGDSDEDDQQDDDVDDNEADIGARPIRCVITPSE